MSLDIFICHWDDEHDLVKYGKHLEYYLISQSDKTVRHIFKSEFTDKIRAAIALLQLQGKLL